MAIKCAENFRSIKHMLTIQHPVKLTSLVSAALTCLRSMRQEGC